MTGHEEKSMFRNMFDLVEGGDEFQNFGPESINILLPVSVLDLGEFSNYSANIQILHYIRPKSLIFALRVRFGRPIFYINLGTYLGYLACLTYYVCMQYPSVKLDNVTGCPLNTTEDLAIVRPEEV